jgi:microcystin degradation protein MlrC
MRLFAATLATETNTFSPLPTSLASYQESVFLRPGEHPQDAPRSALRRCSWRAAALRPRASP